MCRTDRIQTGRRRMGLPYGSHSLTHSRTHALTHSRTQQRSPRFVSLCGKGNAVNSLVARDVQPTAGLPTPLIRGVKPGKASTRGENILFSGGCVPRTGNRLTNRMGDMRRRLVAAQSHDHCREVVERPRHESRFGQELGGVLRTAGTAHDVYDLSTESD